MIPLLFLIPSGFAAIPIIPVWLVIKLIELLSG
jgi:hypothetical protein